MTEENLPSELKVGYQRPDRNLALELVRVTEAAATGGRPLGRPRRQERRRRRRGRGHAQDDLDGDDERRRRHRRGREGRGADALQRRARRRRHRPRRRRGGRPHRRHHAAPRASATPSRSWPSPSAAPCTTPARCSTWTSSSPAPRRPTSSTSGCPSRRTSAGSPRPRAARPDDITVVMLDRPRHEALAAEVRAAGARLRFISDGDVAGAIMAARPDTGVDLLLGIGGTPEGIITACAIKCLGGVIQGRLWPTRRRGAAAGHRRRARPRRGAVHRRPRPRRELLLRRHRHHRRRAAQGRPLPRRRRDHPLPGDALQERHVRVIEGHHQISKLRAYSPIYSGITPGTSA